MTTPVATTLPQMDVTNQTPITSFRRRPFSRPPKEFRVSPHFRNLSSTTTTTKALRCQPEHKRPLAKEKEKPFDVSIKINKKRERITSLLRGKAGEPADHLKAG